MIEKELLLRSSTSRRCPTWSTSTRCTSVADWDPSNEYSVCKDWGSTGLHLQHVEDHTRDHDVERLHRRRRQNEASGEMSVLDTADNLSGMYFWANGIDWTTEKDGGPRRLREVPGRRVRPAHQGVRQLSVDGDRRGRVHVVDGVERRRPAGIRAHRRRRWRPRAVEVGPRCAETELWMDNYVIPAGRPEPRRRVRLDQLVARARDLDPRPRRTTATT